MSGPGSAVSTQQWVVRRCDDTWTARREGIVVTGTSEEDLRLKLRDHVRAPYRAGAAIKLRRTWVVTVYTADEEEDDEIGFDLFD